MQADRPQQRVERRPDAVREAARLVDADQRRVDQHRGDRPHEQQRPHHEQSVVTGQHSRERSGPARYPLGQGCRDSQGQWLEPGSDLVRTEHGEQRRHNEEDDGGRRTRDPVVEESAPRLDPPPRPHRRSLMADSARLRDRGLQFLERSGIGTARVKHHERQSGRQRHAHDRFASGGMVGDQVPACHGDARPPPLHERQQQVKVLVELGRGGDEEHLVRVHERLQRATHGVGIGGAVQPRRVHEHPAGGRVLAAGYGGPAEVDVPRRLARQGTD